MLDSEEAKTGKEMQMQTMTKEQSSIAPNRDPNIDPGFYERRVKRPNPMDKWDAETQQNIKKDFDALRKELFDEHKTAECKKLDNEYASALYKKFKNEENNGRELLKWGFDPVTFIYGSYLLGKARFALFCLGHEVLHGTYNEHEDPLFQGKSWENPLYINDKHWKHGHNQCHHKTPGVFGLDPEASPVNYRGSDDFYAEKGDRISALFTPYILNFHSLFFIGIVEAKKVALHDKNAWKDLLKTNLALAKKEYIDYPLKAWLNAPRVWLGNFNSFFFAEVISGFMGRTTHIRTDTTCLHINEFDPNDKAHFYIVSLLNAGNVNLKKPNDFVGGFDTHIEHHLFPFLSSRMLKAASPKVKAICKKYDLPYHEGNFWQVAKVGYFIDLKNLFVS